MAPIHFLRDVKPGLAYGGALVMKGFNQNSIAKTLTGKRTYAGEWKMNYT